MSYISPCFRLRVYNYNFEYIFSVMTDSMKLFSFSCSSSCFALQNYYSLIMNSPNRKQQKKQFIKFSANQQMENSLMFSNFDFSLQTRKKFRSFRWFTAVHSSKLILNKQTGNFNIQAKKLMLHAIKNIGKKWSH